MAGVNAGPTFTVGGTAGPVRGGLPEGDLAPVAEDAPFSLGVSLGAFSTPALGDNRTMTTRATLLDRNKRYDAIYTVDSAGTSFVPVYQTGKASDDAGFSLDEGTYRSFTDPVISPSGRMAFKAKLQGVPASENEGVWTDVFSPVPNDRRLILRKGQSVPGFTQGEALKSILALSLRDDQLLAIVTLLPQRGVISGANDSALVLLTGLHAGAVLLQEGTELPNHPNSGMIVKSFSLLQSPAGSPGQGRWHAEDKVLVRVTLKSGQVRLVTIGTSGTVEDLFATNETAPVIAQDAKFKAFGAPAISPDGTLQALAATLQPLPDEITPKDDGVVLATGTGGTDLIAREGNPIYGITDAPRFANFQDPVINDDGRVVFLATLQGPGVTAKNKSGLFFRVAGSGVFLVARLGSEVPDRNGASIKDVVLSKIVSYALSSDAAGGSLLLLAEVKGPGVTAKNKLRFYALSGMSMLKEVIRTSDTLSTNGPTVTKFSLLNALPGSTGTARSYNQMKSVALVATFSDQTQRIVRVDLP